MDLLLLSLAWTVYYLVHSLLAATCVKAVFQPLFGNFYRLFYTIFASASLVTVLYFHYHVKAQPLFSNIFVELVGVLLIVGGTIVMILALGNYNLAEFVGVSHIQNSIVAKSETPVLITTGLQGKIRHPLYLGGLLFVWGCFLAFPSVSNLVLAGITTGYIFIGAYWEEKKLVAEFGEAYTHYQKAVPMLFPRIK